MNFEISTLLLVNYVLLLARSSGFLVFLPLPGARRLPAAPKVVLAVMLAVLMVPRASGLSDPSLLEGAASPWILTGMIASEAAFGIAIGSAVGLLLEALGLGAQILGFQAGYSYINMVDPTSQVDASVLNVILALLGSLLFFAFDLHIHLLGALFLSLDYWPLGSFLTKPADGLMVVQLGSAVFVTAVRLAFPIVAVLLLIDLTLGLLNQIHSRMQLLTLAFPAKIIAATALLYPVLLVAPTLFHDLAEQAYQVVTALAVRP